MRKLSDTRDSLRKARAVDIELHDTRPRRIPGSTITSWPGAIDVELTVLLNRARDGATIGGGLAARETANAPACADDGTVSLSDGTRITFTTAGQLSVLRTV